jgi:S1-C subfamily serine protease
VRKISDQLISSGHVTRGWLGIVAQPITPNIAKGMNLPNTNGVLAIGIYDNGPAADLQPGDVLLSVNGIPISSAGQLRNQIADLVPGSTLTLQVWHNGKSVQRSIKVGTRPEKVQGI